MAGTLLPFPSPHRSSGEELPDVIVLSAVIVLSPLALGLLVTLMLRETERGLIQEALQHLF